MKAVPRSPLVTRRLLKSVVRGTTLRAFSSSLHAKTSSSFSLARAAWGLGAIAAATGGFVFAEEIGGWTAVVEKADELYNSDEFAELYEYLREHIEDSDCAENAEVLWRYARAQYEKANSLGTKTEKKEMMKAALDTAAKALEFDDKNFAVQKWNGILISEYGNFVDLKNKIQNAYVIRQHFDKAVELNPTDPTSRHLIGMWCFTFAELSWLERKIAGAIFASPPQSSYEEALSFFEKAEALEPGFYKKNRFMIARCHYALGNKDKAKAWFAASKDIAPKSEEEQKIDQQADFMMKYKL